MDEFNSDIFTFRRDSSISSIADDVVIKGAFRAALLEDFDDDEYAEVVAYFLGFSHITFN